MDNGNIELIDKIENYEGRSDSIVSIEDCHHNSSHCSRNGKIVSMNMSFFTVLIGRQQQKSLELQKTYGLPSRFRYAKMKQYADIEKAKQIYNGDN